MNPAQHLALSTATLVALALPLAAGTTVESFTGGTNTAGWTFNVTTPDVIEPSGGNPGAWLHNPLVDSFAPIVTTTFGVPSAFVGDLRAKAVLSISLSARTDAATFGAAGRQLTLLLRDTNGTPSDFDDDDFAYSVGATVPQVGAGWKPFHYTVPSLSTDPVPAGWKGGWSGDIENFRPGIDWNDVITSVDRVEVWWIDPSFFAIFQQWDVGVDQIAVVSGAPEAFCFGSDAACPCGNGGAADAGCDNPAGTGGVALAMSSYAPNGVGGGSGLLTGTGYPPLASPTAIVIRSTSFSAIPILFGDGLRCLGTPLVRFGATTASGGTSTHPVTHGAGAGAFAYQLWYRSTPIGFCDPAAAFNTSNAVEVIWP